MVQLGLRHLDAGPENRFFTGSIDDARIYAGALSAEQIAALKSNQPSDPKPLAWWDFENGAASDRMKTGTHLRNVQRELLCQQGGSPDDVLSPGGPGQLAARPVQSVSGA